MKKWNVLTNSFLAGILAVCAITGCRHDELPDDGNGNPPAIGKAVYMSIDVSLPSGGSTRADALDTEPGQDFENGVSKILLALAGNDNELVTYGIVENMTVNGNSTTHDAVRFDETGIGKFYDSNGALRTDHESGIRVFVFCNPTEDLIQSVEDNVNKTDWRDAVYKVTIDADGNSEIWNENGFLMSNSEMAVRSLPKKLSDWSSYTDPSRAFDLSGDNNGVVNNGTTAGKGPVKVERSVARIDFKDGSTGNNTYDITLDDGSGDTGNMLNVQLVRMALVNMSNSFYHLRRVSDDGKGGNSQFLGGETTDNFVDDTDSNIKGATPLDYNELHNIFHYPLFSKQGKIDQSVRQGWYTSKISDVLNGGQDQTKQYRIWRYVTENAIPKPLNNQRAGVSTGVVFKGKLLAGTGLDAQSDLAQAIGGTYAKPTGVTEDEYIPELDGIEYPVLYLFQNKLYVGWEAGVKEANEYQSGTALYSSVNNAPEGLTQSPDACYTALCTAIQTNGDVNAALAAFRKAATAAGFTLYQASDDKESDTSADKNENEGPGYYFYYYHWIRHRSNSNNNQMGAMEFATVRNNVYKLAVTKISKLGYPRITDNNPDPIEPEDPDETDEKYITVTVEVLPWTVRENNIEF